MYHHSIPTLPNFFLAGAPKAGTTSLYSYLRQHPDIYMSPVKEPSYFASEVRPENLAQEYRAAAVKANQRLRGLLDGPDRGAMPDDGFITEWADYLKLFAHAGGQCAVGEASVCYLWSPTAARNIYNAVPHAKIILILRDPAERAFSQYLHNAADGAVRASFHDQIRAGARNERREFHPLYPFLENGLYFESVTRYLDLFPRENVRIYIYEEVWKEPSTFVRNVFEFVGVDPGHAIDCSKRQRERRAPRSLTAQYLLSRSSVLRSLRLLAPEILRPSIRRALFRDRAGVTLEAADRGFLHDYYREDIRKLEGLLRRELSAWLE